VTDGAGHNILLVGNGGYATIQAAINAAAAGDTILVGPGTFAGATIGKELTIIGQGSAAGGTIITSGSTQNGFLITGDVDATAADSTATVTIQGFKFTGNAVGVSASSTTELSHLVVTNSDFASNTIQGIGTGNGVFGLSAIDITNSTFERNGNGSHNGDGDIVLFGFIGDALIKNVTITGGTNSVPTNANADTAIQINGRQPTSYDVTHPIGNVIFDNVAVTGMLRQGAGLYPGLYQSRRAELPEHWHDPQRPCRLGLCPQRRPDRRRDIGRHPQRSRRTGLLRRRSRRCLGAGHRRLVARHRHQ
jgi:hypothetical protein